MFLLLLAGCKDELVLPEEPTNNSVDVEGDCLQFTMRLDKDMSSRDITDINLSSGLDENYDNYIDTQDKFRVFFFTEKGDFLFGATDRIVGSLAASGDYNADYYYVRIPMTMIVDRENQEYDIDKIKKYLKEHPFKIAVLANWPNAGDKVNPADWDDSEGTPNGGENPSSTLKGHPQWNWSNSILNKDANAQDIRNINDLHHIFDDAYYASTQSRLDVYGEFLATTSGSETGHFMGEPTDWVKMMDIDEGWHRPNNKDCEIIRTDGEPGFENKNEANAWIRANWTPNVDLNQGKKIYRHYQHMWFLWNFDASYKTGEKKGNITYSNDGKVTNVGSAGDYVKNWEWKDRQDDKDPVSEEFGKEWYKRNGDLLYKWMEKSYNDGKNPLALEALTIDIGESNNDVFFKYTRKTDKPGYCVRVGDNYGIQLPDLGAGEKTTYEGMMNFQARTTGTLRIKWGSYDGTSSGIAVQVDLPKNTNGTIEEAVYKTDLGYSYQTPKDFVNTTDGMGYLDISVSEGSRPVYIFGVSGKPVIYSIEFIRGKYLWETDREGIAPGPLQGIPMYGVQDYEPMPDWKKGTTFNLPGNVNLIRALAKVEVYIKTDFGMPRHMIMRNMNRAARCEPIDVHTPTEVIWSGNLTDYDAWAHTKVHPDGNGTGELDAMCEWYRIQKYGTSYTTSDYKGWLSWFYGSWKNENQMKVEGIEYPLYWKPQNGYKYDYDLGYYIAQGDYKGWSISSNPAVDLSSPHIFNPYIYRSDFCRFLYAGDTHGSAEDGTSGEGYYKFVLYMPEKNISDPVNPGDLSSTPLVAHIEYRFAPSNLKTGNDEPQESEVAGAADDPYSNTEYNLDDNDCYRIYFTNYGSNPSGENGPVNEALKSRTWYKENYDEYEKDKTRLDKHWPIMRNHKYKLYIGGSGPENPEIKVKVTDWGHRKVVLEW